MPIIVSLIVSELWCSETQSSLATRATCSSAVTSVECMHGFGGAVGAVWRLGNSAPGFGVATRVIAGVALTLALAG